MGSVACMLQVVRRLSRVARVHAHPRGVSSLLCCPTVVQDEMVKKEKLETYQIILGSQAGMAAAVRLGAT
jgi:hypothetical protein